MNDIRIIPADLHLIDEVVSIIDGDVNALSRHLVVFPGQRPAHFLRKALALRFGKGYRPPMILSYENFINHVVSSILKVQRPGLEPLDAVSLLLDVHCGMTTRLGSDHFMSPEEFLPLGFRLYEELEDLHRAEVSSRQITETVGGLTFGSYHLIPGYYEQFYRKVEGLGFTTPATRLRIVADQFDEKTLSAFDVVVCAGFYSLTAVDRRIFGRILEREKSVLVFQEGKGLQKHLKEIGIERESPGAPKSVDRLSCHLYDAPDLHGQVFALSEKVRELMASGEVLDERTAIVLPSPEALFPVLHQTLPLLSENSYNISLRYPLSRTPAFGFLSALLKLLSSRRNGRFRISEYLSFVLHPYVKNIRFGKRADVTRILFHTLENRMARNRYGVSFTLEELEQDNSVFDIAARGGGSDDEPVRSDDLKNHLREIHDRTIRAMSDPASLKDLADRCIEVLLFIQDRSTATHHPLFTPYAHELMQTLRELSTSPVGVRALADIDSYERFLGVYVRSSLMPFPRSTPLKGVQVLGLLETRNLSFDRVFVLDATDDVLPGSGPTEALLPQALREKLGLETRKDHEALTEYYLDLLKHSSREIHFFYSEGGKKESSRYLQKLIWQWEQEDGQINENGYSKSIRYRIRLSNPPPKSIPKTPAVVEGLKKIPFSGTALDTYLTCQLRFYYRYVLDLEERDEAGDDLDHRQIGILVHKILARFFEPTRDAILTEDHLDKRRLAKVTEEVCRDTFGPDLSGTPSLVKRQVVRQLERFLDDYQLPLIKGQEIEIKALEQPISVVCGGYTIEGRIDRVERRGGTTVILDYKTGKDDENLKIRFDKLDVEDQTTWGDAIGSLQLPMYMLLYAGLRGESVERIQPAYVFLGRMDMRNDVEVGLRLDSMSRTEAGSLVERVIVKTMDAICDPAEDFKPPTELKTTCPGCSFQSICGTQWTTGPADFF